MSDSLSLLQLACLALGCEDEPEKLAQITENEKIKLASQIRSVLTASVDEWNELIGAICPGEEGDTAEDAKINLIGYLLRGPRKSAESETHKKEKKWIKPALAILLIVAEAIIIACLVTYVFYLK